MWAFLEENLASSSDKDLAKAHIDYLGSFLNRLNAKASKGVHATVTYEESVRSILYTYLTLGDLLEFAPKQLGMKLTGGKKINVNSASVEDLSKTPGITRDFAKEIVKARVKEPFAKLDELNRMKGVGPKTIEKLRTFLVALPMSGHNEDSTWRTHATIFQGRLTLVRMLCSMSHTFSKLASCATPYWIGPTSGSARRVNCALATREAPPILVTLFD